MRNELQIAVENESEHDLIYCLDYKNPYKIEPDSFYLIEKALLGKWHSQHEDLVNKIYLENIIDDRFVEPILKIALNKESFRYYDDDLESALRKCVHALKTIDSEKSNQALKILEEINNDNVKYVLEMYE